MQQHNDCTASSRRTRCPAGGAIRVAVAHAHFKPSATGAPAPDECGVCGRPWVAVSDTVGRDGVPAPLPADGPIQFVKAQQKVQMVAV